MKMNRFELDEGGRHSERHGDGFAGPGSMVVILQIWSFGGQFCGAHGASAPPSLSAVRIVHVLISLKVDY
jgi:hypothetical protein